MASAPINPTQLTPPRVAVIDERTGAISREWYRFFLSLLTSTQNTSDAADTQPDTNSLLATYDAMLASLTQEVQTNTSDLTASLQQQINDVFTSSSTQPRAELGTMASVQQDNVRYLGFATSPSPPVVSAPGVVVWNNADGTLDIGMGYDGVTQQVGLEQYFRIKASATITDGQCVMFTGSVGASGVLKGAPATGVTNPQYIMGVATMDIANNGFGYITSFGLVRGINTTGSSVGETWVDGDILYYNPAYTGGLTKVPPTAPLPKVVVASVVNAGSGGSGSLFIRVQGEPDLHNLSDVYAPSPISNGQILIGDGPQSRWEAATLTAGTAINIANGAGSVTITNTAPDQIVSLTAGTGISISGTYPSFTITNTLPDQIVSLTGAGTTVVTGTYPNFTITSNDQYVGTVTSVSGTGTVNGITLTGTVTSSGSLTLGGTLGGIANSQLTNSSITINGSAISLGGSVSVGTVTSVSGTGTVNGITLTGTVTSSGSLTLGGTLSGVSLTTQVSGTLPVGNGGTGTATAFTAGSVVFAGASGVYSQKNANFFWDNTNNRLGIGTASPNSILTVGGNPPQTGAIAGVGSSGGISLALSDNVNSSLYVKHPSGGVTQIGTDGGGQLALCCNGFSEVARLNNGYFLINETSASAASLQHNLEVNGDIMANGSAAGLFWANRSATPSAGANWYGWYTTGGTIYLYNPAAGNIASINASTGAYTALSDAAKKKDFEPSAVGLDAVLALKPTLFRMDTDADDAPKQLGFVAQEVKDHIPQAYVEEQNTDAGGNESTYIGLNDRPIIAALVKAVQELEARVAQLEG